MVGISGFGGSGKSTLARQLATESGGWIRVRGDDFLDPVRSHRRSSDWDGVERTRLAEEVLIPFRERRPSKFRRFDWGTRALGRPEPLPLGDVLLVDLVGLFHPEVLALLDVTIWCDVELAEASQRGMGRDLELGRDHNRLWNDVWIPNERDFSANFAPRQHAQLLFK